MASPVLPHPTSTVFLCCDVQERFRPLITAFPSVVSVASLMIQAGKVMGIPVIATEQYPQALGHTVPELDVKADHVKVYEKSKFSMLTDEVLGRIVTPDTSVRSAVLFGIEAHVCVLQTALELRSLGVDVHVLIDGTSSQRNFDRVAGFKRMEQSGAYLTTSESMLFQLMQDSKYENFKQISAMLKEGRPNPELPISSL